MEKDKITQIMENKKGFYALTGEEGTIARKRDVIAFGLSESGELHPLVNDGLKIVPAYKLSFYRGLAHD